MYQNQNRYNPYAQNIAIVKEYFKKPLVLVIAILYIATLICSFYIAATAGNSMSDMYSYMFESTGAYDQMTYDEAQILNMFTNSSFMSVFFIMCMIPSFILIGLQILAYFLIYFKSKNNDPSVSPKGGATIMFVISILSLIGAIFAALMLLLYAVILAVAGVAFMSDPSIASGDGAIGSAIFFVLCVLMIVITALLLTYSISHLSFYNSIRKSLTSVKLYNKGAGVFGVFSIIYGVFGIFSAITTLFSAPLMSLMSTLLSAQDMGGFPIEVFDKMAPMYTASGFSAMLSAVIMILTGVLALGYKKHINKYTNAFAGEQVEEAPMQSAPVYAQPTYTQPEYTQPTAPQESASATSTCPQCGTACDANAIFCNNCGNRIK